MLWNLKHVGAAIWYYLNQPLCDEVVPSVWEVNRFWYLYKIQHLESCWLREHSSESHYTQ